MKTQRKLSTEDMIKIVQQPEYSWNKLIAIKDKYNISDKDFNDILFHVEMYYISQEN